MIDQLNPFFVAADCIEDRGHIHPLVVRAVVAHPLHHLLRAVVINVSDRRRNKQSVHVSKAKDAQN